MHILEANEIALQKHMPGLWDSLKKQEQISRDQTFFQCAQARDGSLIDMMSAENTSVYLQSQYRPLEEAKRFVKQYGDAKKGSVFLFLGMGNGYIMRELIAHRDITCIFYEPSASYFLHVLMHYDISDVLCSGQMHLYVEGINANAMKLEMYAYVNELNWHLFYLEAMPKYQQIYPDSMNSLVEIYEDSKLHGRQNYKAVIGNTEAEFENMLQNMRYICYGSSIKYFENILSAEVPVIVVAAGPSLEKNISLLQDCRNRAFILCVDRAAPILAKYGILPHAIVTADAIKEPELFQDAQSQSVPWFVYTTSQYKGLCQLNSHKIIFVSSICKYAGYLYRLLGSDLGELVNGGSVATVAVSVAEALGSKRIILIGQDLALTDDKVHAGEQEGAVDSNQEYLVKVKGYYGGTVISREDFKAYLDWYEAFVAREQDITFVNATEGGAYIEGMQHMSLADAMKRYGTEHFDGDAVLSQVPEFMTDERQASLLREYHVLTDYFAAVKREVGGAITWMQRGIDILQKGKLTDSKLEEVERHMNAFLELYNSYEGHTVLDLLLGKEIQEALLDLSFTNENLTEELKRLYTKMHIFFSGIERAVSQAIPLLDAVLMELEQKG